MAKPAAPRRWTVLENEPIRRHTENLWSIAGEIPGMGGMNRRMAVARLADGRLLFYNAVPVNEAALAELRAFGRPAILVVPHRGHMMDAHAFREKLSVDVYCPAPELEAVRARVEVKGALESAPLDASVAFLPVASTRAAEPVMRVESAGGVSLVFADVIQNTRAGSLPMRLAGFVGGPKVVPLYRLFAKSNKARVKAFLAELAQTPRLARLVPSHGEVFGEREGEDAARALAEAARRY